MTDLTSLLSRAIPEPNTGCLLWEGAVDEKGYGRVGHQGKNRHAHRVSWALHHGIMPPQMVLHRCDTPACINPDHLFLGNASDNMRDMFAKNRNWPGIHPKGEKHWRAKLTEVDVIAIRNRSNTESRFVLAREYNVNESNIRLIIQRKTWRHIP